MPRSPCSSKPNLPVPFGQPHPRNQLRHPAQLLAGAKRKGGLVREALLSGRSTLLLLAGAGYAREKGADAACIGFLDDDHHLSPSGAVELRARNGF